MVIPQLFLKNSVYTVGFFHISNSVLFWEGGIWKDNAGLGVSLIPILSTLH